MARGGAPSTLLLSRAFSLPADAYVLAAEGHLAIPARRYYVGAAQAQRAAVGQRSIKLPAKLRTFVCRRLRCRRNRVASMFHIAAILCFPILCFAALYVAAGLG